MTNNVVAIIQARMGSTRLPGKSLALISGQPLLGHVIDRVRASKTVSEVVVATTDRPDDDVIAGYSIAKKTASYRGSACDVLDRFYQAARMFRADIAVRITADDPFKDPAIIDKIVHELIADNTADYASNTIKPTYPEGLDAEAIRMPALTRAWTEAKLPSDREHVTPYIWRNPQGFNLRGVEHSIDLSHLRWTVDNEQDLAFTRAVYESLYTGSVFSMDSVLALVRANPQLSGINSGVRRNAGYLHSLSQE